MDTRTGRICDLEKLAALLGETYGDGGNEKESLDELRRALEADGKDTSIPEEVFPLGKLPDPGCRRCGGTGYFGVDENSGRVRPCECVNAGPPKKVTRAIAEIKAVKKAKRRKRNKMARKAGKKRKR